jgi:hypothetical protein
MYSVQIKTECELCDKEKKPTEWIILWVYTSYMVFSKEKFGTVHLNVENRLWGSALVVPYSSTVKCILKKKLKFAQQSIGCSNRTTS